MRVALVLAIAIPVLFAFGVACGGDEQEAQMMPSPASESEGEAEEVDETGEVDEAEAEEEETVEVEEEEEGPVEACLDSDHDALCDGDPDLCPDTPAGSVVDDVGCSDAQVDQDNDGICDPAAPSDGPGDCALIDDNCPESPNPAQDDSDGDLEGDACDRDDDNDGFTDSDEDIGDSDPLDAGSVPENEAVNPGSCTDGVDNNGNTRVDDADWFCD